MTGGSDKTTAPPPQPKASVKTVTAPGDDAARHGHDHTARARDHRRPASPHHASVEHTRARAFRRQRARAQRPGLLEDARRRLQRRAPAPAAGGVRAPGVGPSDPYEAYANYNLGYSLLKLGRCSEAVPYLQRAQHLEPERPEPKQALAQAKRC